MQILTIIQKLLIMTDIFFVLGFNLLLIFFLFIVKFIYDTFLTNNTDETKECYKKNYPEANDRWTVKDINAKPKTNINDRQRSVYEIAKNMNTTPELAQEVSNTYFQKRYKLEEIENQEHKFVVRIPLLVKKVFS